MTKRILRAMCPGCGKVRAVTPGGQIWSHGPCSGSRARVDGWPVLREDNEVIVLYRPAPHPVADLPAEHREVVATVAAVAEELAEVNRILAGAGIEAQGAAGVRELVALLEQWRGQ